MNKMRQDETGLTGEEKRIAGLISAMENEVILLKDSMDIETTEAVSGMTFYRGKLSGREAVLVQCGRGKVNAGVCAQTLILRFGVNSIINTGVAGSLNSEINIGSIVISTDAIQHDVDVTALGHKRGTIPGNTLSIFFADEELRRSAFTAAGAVVPQKRIVEGRICSGDQFVADSAKKRSLGEDFGAVCCEMEGAAVAQVCAMNAIPFVLIRAISDKADDLGHLSYQGLFEAVARHNAAIVRHMMENG
jgi:5''-methylthioadenosine/S-adenosylhomocysteine nucleosidase